MIRIPTAPANLLPYDSAVVTALPAFRWEPGQNNDAIYLNFSAEYSYSSRRLGS